MAAIFKVHPFLSFGNQASFLTKEKKNELKGSLPQPSRPKAAPPRAPALLEMASRPQPGPAPSPGHLHWRWPYPSCSSCSCSFCRDNSPSFFQATATVLRSQLNQLALFDKRDNMEKSMDDLEHELSKIVGLEELKLQLRKLAKGLWMDEKRRAMGLNLGRRKAPHMTFLGNPGTGKTTVARVLGKLLHSVGVLSSDKVIEVQRSDLVSNYIGETALKTREKIKEAMGGVLFVDEAYRLAIEKSKDYGVEALEEIMSVLEDDDLVVIFAGYTEPMKRVFSANEGFCRRVTNFFQFDDFSCNDLAEMLLLKMNKQDDKSRLRGFKLHPSCSYDAISQVIEKNSYEKLRNKMNGGLVDHMLNNARENLDSRLNFNSIGDELMTITLHDLEAGLQLLAEQRLIEKET